MLVISIGCAPTIPRATSAPVDGISEPVYHELLNAHVTPPLGWWPETLEHSANQSHIVWTSPSGNTAYGIIHFKLPLPVGHELALWGFLQNMRKREGATLSEKIWDANKDCMRFVSVGGVHCVRNNLFVHGFEGWIVYAGTLQKSQINSEELELAEIVREQTGIGQ